MKRIFIILIILCLSVASVFVYLFYRGSGLKEDDGILIEYPDSLKNAPVIMHEYGIPVDSFHIHSGKIKKDQPLASLLQEFGVTGTKIHSIVKASQDVFDLKKIRYGRPYKVFCSPDTLERVCYFVYEHTSVEYLMIDLRDSVKVTTEEKDITIISKETLGSVHTSLWVTMQDLDLDPILAIELSEIYAWSIDFFGLQEGDTFKVLFDEQYVDTMYIGLGKIYGTYFRHTGKDFYGIPFVQDSVESFFDQEGNSLRKAFLKAPLRFSRISSRYSWSRMHPILKYRRPHLGIDYAAPAGTPVYAIGDGKIIEKNYKKGSGHMLKIRHNSVYTTAYLHLGRYGKGINTGTYVKQGDVIGYVGSSGLSTGSHLDFRFYKNGSPIDPLKVEAPPVEPVKEENRAVFDSVKTVIMERLDRIGVSVQNDTE